MKKVFSKAKRFFAITLAVISTFGVAQKADLLPATTVKAISEIEVETAEVINPGDSTGWRRTSEVGSTYGNCYSYFKVTLPYDGEFSCTMTTKGVYYMGFTCYTADLKYYTIKDFTYPHNVPETISAGNILSAGTYVIAVETDDYDEFSLKTSYNSFGVKEAEEDNYESPKSYNTGDTITDALTSTDRVDWYKFNVPASAKYEYKFTSFSDDLYFSILNENANKTLSYGMAHGKNGEPDTIEYSVYLQQGTYYIKVYPFVGGDVSKYTFRVSRSAGETPKLSKAKSSKKKTANITVKKVSGIDGYQIQYSTNKNFAKGTKTKTVSTKNLSGSGNNYKITLKKLKRKKLYYFKVRAYVDVNGNRYYSDWSNVRKVKVK